MKKLMMIYSIKAQVLESGILGKSFTGSNKWLAREIADVMTEHFDKIPPCLYVYSDGGPETKNDNLAVQKSYIALFLQHNFAEVLIARMAANLSYRNPVGRVHSVPNLGL